MSCLVSKTACCLHVMPAVLLLVPCHTHTHARMCTVPDSLPPDSPPPLFLCAWFQVQRNIGVILISSIIWEKFREGAGLVDPLLVHFPAYTKAQAVSILEQRAPSDVSAAHFRQFASLLWDVFHGPCRDLNELGHLLSLFFDTYYQPVREGRIPASNTAALYKSISPLLKSHFSSLYLRETSTSDWLDAIASDKLSAPQASQVRRGRQGKRRRERGREREVEREVERGRERSRERSREVEREVERGRERG